MDSVDYADPTEIGGLNLYAYCNNNPVMYVDPTGHELEWWHKLLIGIGFIVVGALITAATAGTGTGFWAAFGSAMLNSALQVGASMAIGVGVNGIANVVNGNGFFDDIGNTLADSFMWGGIFVGGSQIVSGGFRLLRAKTGFTGINTKSFGLLSPDKLYYDKAGMTIFRVGSRKGTKVALDFGRYGIHAHVFSNLHIPVIPFIVGFIEGFN